MLARFTPSVCLNRTEQSFNSMLVPLHKNSNVSERNGNGNFIVVPTVQLQCKSEHTHREEEKSAMVYCTCCPKVERR